MFRWIFFEIKQLLRNKKNFMIFILLILTNLFIFSTLPTNNDILVEQVWSSMHMNEPSYGPDGEVIRPDFDREKILASNIQEYNKEILIKSLEEANRIERYLLGMKNPDHGSLKEKIDSYYKNGAIHQDLKEKIFEKFGYKDENVDISFNVSGYNSQVSHLQYEYEVFDNGFMLYSHHVGKESLTSAVFIYRFLLRFLVIIIPLSVGFDSFLKDKKDGSIRSIMTLKQSRLKYYFVKLFSTLVVSLMLIFLPLIIVLLINNVNIINDLKYPSFIYKNGLKSFAIIKPIETFLNKGYSLDSFSIHSYTAYSLNEFGLKIGVADSVELVSLGKLLGYSFVLIICLAVLVLSLQLSISLNTNKYLGLLVTLFILISLIFFAQIQNKIPIDVGGFFIYQHVPSIVETLNPMSYLKAVDVVEGTVPFTFLGGVIVLSMYSTIITAVSSLFLKRKDITF